MNKLHWKLIINQSDRYPDEYDHNSAASDAHYLNLPYVKKVIDEFIKPLDSGVELSIYTEIDNEEVFLKTYGFCKM